MSGFLSSYLVWSVSLHPCDSLVQIWIWIVHDIYPSKINYTRLISHTISKLARLQPKPKLLRPYIWYHYFHKLSTWFSCFCCLKCVFRGNALSTASLVHLLHSVLFRAEPPMSYSVQINNQLSFQFNKSIVASFKGASKSQKLIIDTGMFNHLITILTVKINKKLVNLPSYMINHMVLISKSTHHKLKSDHPR
jgi:hypothetical protein